MQATVKQEKTGFLGLMLVSTHKEIVGELKYDHAIEARRLRSELAEAKSANISRGARIADLENSKAATECALRLTEETNASLKARIAELGKPVPIRKVKAKQSVAAAKVPVTGKVNSKTGAVKKKGAAK